MAADKKYVDDCIEEMDVFRQTLGNNQISVHSNIKHENDATRSGEASSEENAASINDNAASGNNKLLYRVTDSPPIIGCFLLAVQIAIMNSASCLFAARMVQDAVCAGEEMATRLIATTLFMTGVGTVLQTTCGLRLPVFQGPNPIFIISLINMARLPIWKCYSAQANVTGAILNGTANAVPNEELLSPSDKLNMAAGALMIASVVHILLGATGAIGFLMRFIGPLTIAPTIALVGITLIDAAIGFGQHHWGITAFTAILFLLLVGYVPWVLLPVVHYSPRKGCRVSRFPVLQLAAVILTLIIGCLLSYILTVTDVLPSDPNRNGYLARTDAGRDIIDKSPWFYFPYPGQFGPPTFSLAIFLGSLVTVISSIIQSIGDYVALSTVCKVPSPPSHAVNRAVLIEGIGSFVAGGLGAGHATTSYSEMIGIVELTKVASRRVYQFSGVILILLAVVGKASAVFVSIPLPVLGGITMIALATLTGAGLATLQGVDMSRSRNVLVLGVALFVGIMIPKWVNTNTEKINTGSIEVDNCLIVLLGNPICVGGFLGCFLDNTMPGKDQKRDFERRTVGDVSLGTEVYDFPFIPKRLLRYHACRFLPFLQNYDD